MNSPTPQLVLAGQNATALWGMSVDERARRIAEKLGISLQQIWGDDSTLLVNRAYVFDPVWLKELAQRPGTIFTRDGIPVIAHCRNGGECSAVAVAMEAGTPAPSVDGMTLLAHEHSNTLVNSELRKREQPFVLKLDPGTVRAAERASYFGAYKGVTDLLTKYLWPEWALVLTRFAARFHIPPNAVTAMGTALCILATILFWHGHYWTGMAAGLAFMVLDTVDGKLARVTITSSHLGGLLDHGVDLIHPPFWWGAWAVGLTAYGRPIGSHREVELIVIIVAGYVIQRVIEGIFIRMFGMHIHVWRRIDSQFRLITARRNPNMLILFVAMLFARPDLGLIAVAWWTVLSCLFHLVRLFQAMIERARGRQIISWLG